MRTSGEGNDGWLILVSVGVSVIIGTVLLGGPENALATLNGIIRDVAQHALVFASRR